MSTAIVCLPGILAVKTILIDFPATLYPASVGNLRLQRRLYFRGSFVFKTTPLAYSYHSNCLYHAQGREPTWCGDLGHPHGIYTGRD